MVFLTECHPDGEAHEREDGQLEDEVDVDGHRYGGYEGQAGGHVQHGAPESTKEAPSQ